MFALKRRRGMEGKKHNEGQYPPLSTPGSSGLKENMDFQEQYEEICEIVWAKITLFCAVFVGESLVGEFNIIQMPEKYSFKILVDDDEMKRQWNKPQFGKCCYFHRGLYETASVSELDAMTMQSNYFGCQWCCYFHRGLYETASVSELDAMTMQSNYFGCQWCCYFHRGLYETASVSELDAMTMQSNYTGCQWCCYFHRGLYETASVSELAMIGELTERTPYCFIHAMIGELTERTPYCFIHEPYSHFESDCKPVIWHNNIQCEYKALESVLQSLQISVTISNTKESFIKKRKGRRTKPRRKVTHSRKLFEGWRKPGQENIYSRNVLGRRVKLRRKITHSRKLLNIARKVLTIKDLREENTRLKMQEAGIDNSTKRLVREYQEKKDMIRSLFRLQQVGFAV